MTSALQNFKRHLLPGTKCMFTAKWCPVPTSRTVVEVRSKDCSFTNPNPGKAPSWLNFPKKSELTEEAPNVFKIAFSDCPDNVLTYDFNPTV